MGEENVIAIIGCGLVGSLLANPLASVMHAAEWSASVLFIDNDEIAHRNSPSSLPMTRVGQKKARYMSEFGKSLGLVTKYLTTKVTPENALTILNGATLIIGAVDNNETRMTIWATSMALQAPYIDLGVNDFSGIVSWSFGDLYDAHPFSPSAMQVKIGEQQEKEKQPPCTLFGTRKIASLVAELATQSISIFWRGHDPDSTISSITGNEAKRGDLLGWVVTSHQESIVAKPAYVGRKKW